MHSSLIVFTKIVIPQQSHSCLALLLFELKQSSQMPLAYPELLTTIKSNDEIIFVADT